MSEDKQWNESDARKVLLHSQQPSPPPQGKIRLLVQHLQDGHVTGEYDSIVDLDVTGTGHTDGLIERIRTLFRSELIKRGLIVPTPDDTKRRR